MSRFTFAPVAAFAALLPLAALLLLAGCDTDALPPPDAGGDAGPPTDAAVDERSFEALCFDPELYCARLYECATAERLDTDQLVFGHTDEASCVSQQALFTGAICGQLAASIDGGRMTVDLPRLATCADSMVALSCERFVHDPPEAHPLCEGSPFVAPAVGPGGACAIDAECSTPGSLCAGSGEEAAGGLGLCRAAPELGEACVDDRCAEGLVCEDGVCAEPTPGRCRQDFDCGVDGWCDQPGVDFREEYLDPELEGTCAPRLGLGEECEDVQACEDALYCEDTNGADSEGFRLPGHCAAPRGPGEACNEPADCVSFDCDDLDSGTCR